MTKITNELDKNSSSDVPDKTERTLYLTDIKICIIKSLEM